MEQKHARRANVPAANKWCTGEPPRDETIFLAWCKDGVYRLVSYTRFAFIYGFWSTNREEYITEKDIVAWAVINPYKEDQ